jgi:diacylglycerol kinase family enzyme
MELINELQTWNFKPEVHLLEPGNDLLPMIEDALYRGISLFVVSGGDGTIDTVAGGLAGTHATLGIIPTGTQNNVALSLGIPGDIPTAVSLLRTGQRIMVDVGVATCGEIQRHFLEACSVGLLSAVFPAADDIQHGNLARIGDFLATLVTSPPADMHLVLDKQQEIDMQGHVVLVGNMPYIGPHYQIAAVDSFQDGLLDLMLFANLSKLDLLGNALQISGGLMDDPRIQRYHVRSLFIDTNPPMPILTDGFTLGEGSLHIHMEPASLAVMVDRQPPPTE